MDLPDDNPTEMAFADDLFGGGRVLRGVLFVVAVLTFAAFVSLPPERTATATAVRYGLEGALLLLALAMLSPVRFRWAGRALCGLVVLVYVAYVVSELVAPSGPTFTARRSSSSLGNAIMGLIVIGGPALVYALRSRKRREPFELHFGLDAKQWGPSASADEGAALRGFCAWLAPRLVDAGWTVEGPHPDDGARVIVLEREGTRTILGVAVEPLEHDGEQGEPLHLWHVWLWRDQPVDWRDEPLAALVDEACRELCDEMNAVDEAESPVRSSA